MQISIFEGVISLLLEMLLLDIDIGHGLLTAVVIARLFKIIYRIC